MGLDDIEACRRRADARSHGRKKRKSPRRRSPTPTATWMMRPALAILTPTGPLVVVSNNDRNTGKIVSGPEYGYVKSTTGREDLNPKIY